MGSVEAKRGSTYVKHTVAFELSITMARALGLQSRGCEFDSPHKHSIFMLT